MIKPNDYSELDDALPHENYMKLAMQQADASRAAADGTVAEPPVHDQGVVIVRLSNTVHLCNPSARS